MCYKLDIIVCKKQLVGTIFRTNIQASCKINVFCFPLSREYTVVEPCLEH